MAIGVASVMLVAVGGALGGMGRLFVSRWAAARLGTDFPWGTLIVNLAGAFLIGWLAVSLTVGAGLSLWLMTGILGGFTTVSSFSLQTLDLMRERRWMAASANVCLTLVLGIAAAALGVELGR
ncbi:putative fluoride ion transporter CrcB [Halomonas cupida]|uniref:Fluoride-specific ion channel FluC n=1 Tax=Halomonas cupida TaxID=44933 RepID=A0A1M7KYR2_9GAMM|nr:CrcB family protein [Halomonas cupida]GEN22753.1 putative fluoride ion transporter CrcB [Halomonas cupida]SHM70195.1 CrcB protein [Halomonas cupida]